MDFSEEIVPAMNGKQFKVHFKLDVHVFEMLLQKMHSLHKKRNIVTVGHPDISIDKCCMIMIWYLSNMESLRSVANRFGVSKSTCWAVLYRTCKLLLDVNMQHHIIAWPSQSQSETIINKFRRRHGMPGIIGAIDGTHICINAPKEHHCSYINRKNYHSVLLQGVCESDLLFIDIYTRQPGYVHDAALFKKSDIYSHISTNNIMFPNNTHLIGDKDYPLTSYLMVPFKDSGNLTRREKNFNLVLSKSRVVIENAYALLKGRFRRLKYRETVRMEFIVLLIMSAIILHNLCILCNDKLEEVLCMEEQPLEETEPDSVAVEGDSLRNHVNAAAIQKRRNIASSLPFII